MNKWINSYSAFVKFKQWTIQITSDKRFKREMMEGFEVFHYIWREYLRRQSLYWAEKPPSCWMDMLRAKWILAGNQVEEIRAPAVCFEANDAHQRYDSLTADIFLWTRHIWSTDTTNGKWVFMNAFVISITATSHTAAGKRVLKFSSGFRLGCYWE